MHTYTHPACAYQLVTTVLLWTLIFNRSKSLRNDFRELATTVRLWTLISNRSVVEEWFQRASNNRAVVNFDFQQIKVAENDFSELSNNFATCRVSMQGRCHAWLGFGWMTEFTLLYRVVSQISRSTIFTDVPLIKPELVEPIVQGTFFSQGHMGKETCEYATRQLSLLRMPTVALWFPEPAKANINNTRG